MMRGLFVSTTTEVQQMEKFLLQGYCSILCKAIKRPILEESSCDMFSKANLVGLRQLHNMLVDGMILNVLKIIRNVVGTWGM